jgi:hypothetical protein
MISTINTMSTFYSMVLVMEIPRSTLRKTARGNLVESSS